MIENLKQARFLTEPWGRRKSHACCFNKMVLFIAVLTALGEQINAPAGYRKDYDRTTSRNSSQSWSARQRISSLNLPCRR